MFESVKQGLEVVVFIAILIMFFGLVARSNLRAARVFGWFSIAWAVAVAIIEGYGWYDKGDWLIVPAKQLWYQIDRSSLNGLEFFLESYFSTAIAIAADWLLSWPAWLVLGIIGVFFLIYDHVQVQRMHKGAPPPPLWKRLYWWAREMADPDREQA